jgi:hypothetical protein
MAINWEKQERDDVELAAAPAAATNYGRLKCQQFQKAIQTMY